MEGKYILHIDTGENSHTRYKNILLEAGPQAETKPEDWAKAEVRREQALNCARFPFSPPIVKGTLYRACAEINGSEFVEKVEEQAVRLGLSENLIIATSVPKKLRPREDL